MAAMCAGIFSIAAFADGTVTKQKKCALIVNGITGLTKGQSVSVTAPGGTSAEAKVTAIKSPKAALELDDGSCGENFQGATVSTTAPNIVSTKTGTKKMRRFSINVQGGYASINLVRKEGSASSLPYAGPEIAAEFRFVIPVGTKVGLPLAVGGGWQEKAVPLRSTATNGSVQNYTQSWSAPFARVGAGTQFDINSKIRLGALGFFDFGFGGSLAKTGDVIEKLPISTNLRYGGAVEGDFAILPNLRAGATGNFFMGSLGLKEFDYITDATNPTSITTSQSFSGFGGSFKVSFEF
jgi:hypothetical protein